MWSADKIWRGSEKIVLIFHIGVEYSEVAYAHLTDGYPPLLHVVTSWPGQDVRNQSRKVPTAMWYNNDKKMVFAGEEALTPQAQKDAKENGWCLAKGFPLYRYHNLAAASDRNVDPLPAGVLLSTIYTDYMNYLIKHTAQRFGERMLDGRNIWKIHSKNMTVVFIEPEGQSTQDEAFLQACLGDINHTKINRNIQVTTEGMAYALAYVSDLKLSCDTSSHVLVCSVQNGLTEVTTYEVEKDSTTAHRVEARMTSRACSGFSSIPHNCRLYLFNLFRQTGLSREDTDKYLLVGVQDFELNAMRSFRSSEEDYSIEIANPGFHNNTMRTRRGRMTLNGRIIEGFFEPCVSAILDEVLHHKKKSDIQHILVAGDFADHQFIADKLLQRLDQPSCHILNNITNLSCRFMGALIHGTSNSTRTISKVSLGILIGERYDRSNLAHHGRKIHRGHGGHRIVGNRWSEMVKAGTSIDPASPVRRRMVRSLNPSRDITKGSGKYVCHLWSFDGNENENSGWAKDQKEHVNKGFRKVCHVEAEFARYNGALTRKYKGKGSKDALEMFLVIGVSGLQLEAHIEWNEKGVTKRGPASVIEFA
ncbi:hypothetical protein FS749_009312 [Ceratobasidium sp. UAMH 11750]|nr:hypothetical protein FS749_009312 [Ceratobasidium sp. UAMH 11750]